MAKGGLSRLGYSSARQDAAVKDAQRGEAGSLTAAGCCATHGEYGGIANMKTQKKQNIDVLRPCPKRLPVPDHADMVTEDGTIYHVQSFFEGNEAAAEGRENEVGIFARLDVITAKPT